MSAAAPSRLENSNAALHAPDSESVLAASTGDQPAGEDHLGFAPYVRALAAFLSHPQTRGPLTVSIEGEWGSGKSSFMLQLEEELLRVSEKASPPPLTVRFNPWRHDKNDSVWAAFAIHFTTEILKQQRLFQRLMGYWRLLLLRFNWREGLPDTFRFLCVVALMVVLAFTLIPVAAHKGWSQLGAVSDKMFASENAPPGAQTSSGSGRSHAESAGGKDSPPLISSQMLKKLFDWGVLTGGFLGYCAVLLSVWIKFSHYVKNPLALDIKKYVESPNYKERVSFIEKFHEDFAKVVQACAGRRRIFVFIDDLDRCEVPKAADLMQALNLMIASDPRLIFIFGMDREKIAAGIAVKNESLLPYLRRPNVESKDSVSHESNLTYGVEFGYEFIEKFIQVPFLVPRPSKPDLERFLNDISNPRNQAATHQSLIQKLLLWWRGTQWFRLRALRSGKMADSQAPSLSNSLLLRQEGSSSTGAKTEQWLRFYKGCDSDTVREIVLVVAPGFENNPRRLKQFLNLFRLRAFVAAETGLFDSEDEPVTLEQLGKFTALLLRWPLIVEDLVREKTLLRSLQLFALSGQFPTNAPSPNSTAWAARPDLMVFLRSGCQDEKGKTTPQIELWSLEYLDAEKLLRISPWVRTIEDRPAEVTSAEPTQIGSQPSGSQPLTATQHTVAEAPVSREAPTSRSRSAQTYDIYISYRQLDQDVVEEIRQYLVKNSDFRIFIDSSVIRPGDDWETVIRAAVTRSNAILVCLGVDGLGPGQSQELEEVIAGRRRSQLLIPVLLPGAEPADLPNWLKKLQWVDFRQRNLAELDKIIERLRAEPSSNAGTAAAL